MHIIFTLFMVVFTVTPLKCDMPAYVKPASVVGGVSAGAAASLLYVYQLRLAQQIRQAERNHDALALYKLRRKHGLVKKWLALAGVGAGIGVGGYVWASSAEHKMNNQRRAEEKKLEREKALVLEEQQKELEKQKKYASYMALPLQERLNNFIRTPSLGRELDNLDQELFGLKETLEHQLFYTDSTTDTTALQQQLDQINIMFQQLAIKRQQLFNHRLQKELGHVLVQPIRELDKANLAHYAKLLAERIKNLELFVAYKGLVSTDELKLELAQLKEQYVAIQSRQRFLEAVSADPRLLTEQTSSYVGDAYENDLVHQFYIKEQARNTAGALLADMSEGQIYKIKMRDGTSADVYKFQGKLINVSTLAPIGLSTSIIRNECVQIKPTHAWKVGIAGAKKLDVVGYAPVGMDINAHITRITHVAEGIAAVSWVPDFDTKILELMKKARRIATAHASSVPVQSIKYYSGEGGDILQHHHIENTQDSTCVGHSIAYGLTFQDFNGAAISHLLANHFLKNTQEANTFLEVLGGNKALAFDKSVQACADFSGRPVFVWQYDDIYDKPQISVPGQKKLYTIKPYDSITGPLGGCAGANLFLPEGGIRHSFDSALHLFLIKWRAGGAHCEVLINTSFRIEKLIELNLSNARKVVDVFYVSLIELMKPILARRAVRSRLNEERFTLTLAQDTRLHLELVVQALLDKYSVPDRTMTENIDALQILRVCPEIHEITRLAQKVAQDIIKFLTEKGAEFSYDIFSLSRNLFLWQAHSIHYKWLSLLGNSKAVTDTVYAWWKALIHKRFVDKMINDEKIASAIERVLIDDFGVPVIVTHESYPPSELERAINTLLTASERTDIFFPTKIRKKTVAARAGAGVGYFVGGDTHDDFSSDDEDHSVEGYRGHIQVLSSVATDLPLKRLLELNQKYKVDIGIWSTIPVSKEYLSGLQGVVVNKHTPALFSGSTNTPRVDFLLQDNKLYPMYSAAQASCLPGAWFATA